MAEFFETLEHLRTRIGRLEDTANRVSYLASTGFREVDSDLELSELEKWVAAARSVLEGVFTDAFGADGLALLYGNHRDSAELVERVGDLLAEHDIVGLPARLAEVEDVVSRGREVLMTSPVIPVVRDASLAAELERIVDDEQGGRFTSLYHVSCGDPELCSSCAAESARQRSIQRMWRNFDRQNPHGAERRRWARRAATWRDYLSGRARLGVLRGPERDELDKLGG